MFVKGQASLYIIGKGEKKKTMVPHGVEPILLSVAGVQNQSCRVQSVP